MATPAALRVFEVNARAYRRRWRGSVFTTFLSPVLFLAAMGLGLGSLVDEGTGSTQLDVPYLVFLAPGLLAATAMQTGVGDGSWPVMAAIKWTKTYQAALATPVSARDLVLGHVAWVGARLVLTATAFTLVMALFGALTLPGGILAILPAVLTGLAFAPRVPGYASWLESEVGLVSLFRFGIIPMFLFSGTFFPVEQLPDFLEPLAFITPLWHGVELTRGVALGTAPALAWGWHAAYLVTMLAVGTAFAVGRFRNRLLP